MATSIQGQQASKPKSQSLLHQIREYFLSVRERFLGVFVVLLIIISVVWILSALGKLPTSWATILSTISSLLGIVAFLFPQGSTAVPPSSPIAPDTLPTINYNVIYQDIEIVQEIYGILTQPDVAALVLTGPSGVGKSTLAALVYNYAEQQRKEGNGPFTARPIWRRVDASFTVAGLTDRILNSLGTFIPRFNNLPPQNQALAFTNALDTSKEARLVFIDQFENFLDWGRSFGTTSHPGVHELLNALNHQLLQNPNSRLILTSDVMPWGEGDSNLIRLREYPLKGFDEAESLEFLKSQGLTVDTAGTEFEQLIAGFHGNALALTFLASILSRTGSKNLQDIAHDPRYIQILARSSAGQLLDYIYHQQLDESQQMLLKAFSIYREPVGLAAAKHVALAMKQSDISITSPIQISQATLNELFQQHLLLSSGGNFYQLHPLVANFVRNRFDEGSEQENYLVRQTAHAAAADFYLRQSKSSHVSGNEPRVSRLHLFVEASWQHCRAGQFKEAYELMEREHLFSQLTSLGGYAILLELYQLLLPLNKWKPTSTQASYLYNNLGEVYYALEQTEEAYQYFKEALPLFREEDDRWGEGRTYYNLGLFYSQKGLELKFWGYVEQNWIFLAPSEQAQLSTLQIQKYRQQLTEARNLLRLALTNLEQALFIRREVGDREGIAKTLNHLGRVYTAIGEKELALECYKEALHLAKEVGSRVEEARIFHNLGRLYGSSRKKEKVKALEYLMSALRLQKEVGDRLEEGTTWNNLGRVYDDLGKKWQAWRCYLQALFIGREVGDRKGIAIALHNVGVLYFDEEPYDKAIAFLLLSKAVFEEMHSPFGERVQRQIDLLREKIGPQQFDSLLENVKPPRASEIVEQTLQEGLPDKEQAQIPAFQSFALPTPPAPEPPERKSETSTESDAGQHSDKNQQETGAETPEDQQETSEQEPETQTEGNTSKATISGD